MGYSFVTNCLNDKPNNNDNIPKLDEDEHKIARRLALRFRFVIPIYSIFPAYARKACAAHL